MRQCSWCLARTCPRAASGRPVSGSCVCSPLFSACHTPDINPSRFHTFIMCCADADCVVVSRRIAACDARSGWKPVCRAVQSRTDHAPHLSEPRCSPFQTGPRVSLYCSASESRYTGLSGMRQWGDRGEKAGFPGGKCLSRDLSTDPIVWWSMAVQWTRCRLSILDNTRQW